MRIAREFGDGSAVDLRDVRRLVFIEEGLDLRQRIDEIVCEVGVRGLAYHDQQSNAVLDDRGQFIRPVTDTFVAGKCDPGVSAAVF